MLGSQLGILLRSTMRCQLHSSGCERDKLALFARLIFPREEFAEAHACSERCPRGLFFLFSKTAVPLRSASRFAMLVVQTRQSTHFGRRYVFQIWRSRSECMLPLCQRTRGVQIWRSKSEYSSNFAIKSTFEVVLDYTHLACGAYLPHYFVCCMIFCILHHLP